MRAMTRYRHVAKRNLSTPAAARVFGLNVAQADAGGRLVVEHAERDGAER